MNKRLLFAILVSVVILLSSTSMVYADSVHGNDFLDKNTDKVEWLVEERYFGKRFIVNSPSGFIIPKEKPDSKKGVIASQGGWGENPYSAPIGGLFTLINGDIIDIEAVYLHNGKYWGVMLPSHNYRAPGWVPMDEILLLYEHEDFISDHNNELYDYSDGFDAIQSAERLVIWQWPGSDREKKVVDFSTLDDLEIKKISSDYAFKDPQERVWGYMHIRYSYKSPTSPYIDKRPCYFNRSENGWICLDDPENSNIPVFSPAPNYIKWSPGGIDWSSAGSITMWPPADYKELRSGNTPKNAFLNLFDNKFYLQQQKRIQELNRSRFYANGPDGYAAIRVKPGFDNKILTHWELGQFIYLNGEQLAISHVYSAKEEYWGLLSEQYYENDFEFITGPYPPGWVPMDHLLIRYTGTDFVHDNKDNLYAFSADIRKSITTETFVLWEWPGSDREKIVCGKNAVNNIDLYLDVYNYSPKTGEYAYKDAEGREWVYIATHLNRPIRGWICLDDPENSDIPAFYPAPEPMKWSPDDMDWPPDGEAAWPLLIIVVVALIAILAVAVFMIRKSKPKKPKSGSAT